jgi:hypothetical protein
MRSFGRQRVRLPLRFAGKNVETTDRPSLRLSHFQSEENNTEGIVRSRSVRILRDWESQLPIHLGQARLPRSAAPSEGSHRERRPG